MKKIASFLLLLIAFSACTDDIKRNSPAFEGIKDGIRWRSVDSRALINPENGSLAIVGQTQYETLTLRTNSPNPGTYILGQGSSRQAFYVYEQGDIMQNYATGIAGVEDGEGDGEIVITEYDSAANTITGTFRFNAINTIEDSTDPEVVNFQYGTFYKVPVMSGSIEQ